MTSWKRGSAAVLLPFLCTFAGSAEAWAQTSTAPGPAAPGPVAPARPPAAAQPPAPPPSTPGPSPAPAAPPAAAEPSAPPDEATRASARTAYEEGTRLFEAGDFAGAYTQFKAANELVPAPHAQYYMALSLDRQGQGYEAALAYEQLLQDPELERIGQARVEEVRARHFELVKQHVGQLKLQTVPPATISVDGEPQGQTPVALKLRPGTHQLLLEADGYQTEQVEVAIAPGRTLDETLELQPVPPPAPPPPPVAAPSAPPPPPAVEQRSLVPAYVLLGLTAVSAGVGAYYGVKALSAHNDYEDQPTDARADDVERYQLITDVALGAALTFGITSVVVLLDRGSSEKPATAAAAPRRQLSLTPYATPWSAGAAAKITF